MSIHVFMYPFFCEYRVYAKMSGSQTMNTFWIHVWKTESHLKTERGTESSLISNHLISHLRLVWEDAARSTVGRFPRTSSSERFVRSSATPWETHNKKGKGDFEQQSVARRRGPGGRQTHRLGSGLADHLRFFLLFQGRSCRDLGGKQCPRLGRALRTLW